ncbi:hypothetical protein LCGC14_2284450 [marine sediment metagenome]|uniref:ASCH domain-containing protein n=1 Tax=marine sediment metagenome TaxID=412755 RepID=A0A0F9CSY3_9ZZZZ
MREISFNWTVSAFLAGAKTVTRRDWKDSYAKTFKKGEIIAAYDKQRRFGGRKIGLIKLTQAPYKENSADIPDDDWESEGMHILEGEHKLIDGLTPYEFWQRWLQHPVDLWVIRFRIVGLKNSVR